MDYTTYTLGTFLSSTNETIRRNAMSILKELQRGAPEAHTDHIHERDKHGQCVECGRYIVEGYKLQDRD